MAKVTILSWQEIPSAVEVKDSEGKFKVQLTERFMELIDAIAMRRNLGGSDDYLMQWRKEKQPDREGGAKDVAETVAAELENRFEEIKAAAIAKS